MRFSLTSSQVAMIAGLLATTTSVSAFFRLPCSGPLLRERLDPIVDDGKISTHLHTFYGGNGLNFSMTYDDARASTCSSCKAKADMSNYWIPDLWFKAQNGSVHPIANGGALIYYLQRPANDTEKLTAFPKDFRMVAGDPKLTDFTLGAIEQEAISWACIGRTPAAPEGPAIPDLKDCPQGLRAQVFFPSCWDGVNLDSEDHKSHMAYPSGMNSGSCPDSHPVHLISIFYEVLYSVNDWMDQWYSDKHPFILSTGDTTGYSLHGDFVNGWDIDILQKAVDECTNLSGVIEDCALLELYENEEMDNCMIPPRVDEVVDGWLPTLPGCAGQDNSTCTSNATIGAAKTYSSDVTSLGWSFTGCALDTLDDRTLTDKSTSDDAMTVQTCIDFCESAGYSVAGLEWSRECYCGNTIDTSKVGEYKCMMPCAGDSTEYCGDSQKLSVYQKAGSGTTSATQSKSSTPARSLGEIPEAVARRSARKHKRSHHVNRLS